MAQYRLAVIKKSIMIPIFIHCSCFILSSYKINAVIFLLSKLLSNFDKMGRIKPKLKLITRI